MSILNSADEQEGLTLKPGVDADDAGRLLGMIQIPPGKRVVKRHLGRVAISYIHQQAVSVLYCLA